jgi:hypothetical protein
MAGVFHRKHHSVKVPQAVPNRVTCNALQRFAGGRRRAERHQGLSAAEAIVQACLLRFRPITMTTLAALFGALPLALDRVNHRIGKAPRRRLPCRRHQRREPNSHSSTAVGLCCRRRMIDWRQWGDRLCTIYVVGFLS